MLHNKFWQGFFALAPIIMVFVLLMAYFLFLFFVFNNIDALESSEEYSSSLILGNIGIFLFFVFFMVLISVGSLVYYIVHAANNPNLRENNMLLIWILLFVFANGIGQLIYWIIEIVNKRPKEELAQH